MEFLTPTEVAKELGVSRSTVKRWIRLKRVESVKTLGGHDRIPQSEVERLRGRPFATHTTHNLDSERSDRPLVLIVDDIKDTREALEFWLQDYGFDVMTATEATEALQRVGRQPAVDAYVLDNVLAGSSGVELCRRIKEIDPTALVVFYSGYDDQREALRAGAQAYVKKPRYDELCKVLDTCLQQTKRQTQNRAR